MRFGTQTIRLLNLGQVIFRNTILKAPANPFIDYNFSIVLDDKVTHSLDKHPIMKSKLLFIFLCLRSACF